MVRQVVPVYQRIAHAYCEVLSHLPYFFLCVFADHWGFFASILLSHHEKKFGNLGVGQFVFVAFIYMSGNIKA